MSGVKSMLGAIGEGRVPAWAYVCVASASLLLWRQAFTTFEARNPTSPPRPPDLSADPPIGSIPRLRGISLEASKPTYFLVLQPCACNADFVAPLLKELDGRTRLVLAVASPDSKLAGFRKFVGDRAVVLSDPEFVVGKTLNAVFLPRAYLLDTTSGLVWKQDEPSNGLTAPLHLAVARLAPESGGNP